MKGEQQETEIRERGNSRKGTCKGNKSGRGKSFERKRRQEKNRKRQRKLYA